MKIAIDARALTGRFTGDRTYWKNLIRSLLEIDTENEYLLFSRLPLSEEDTPKAANVTLRAVRAKNDRLWTLFTLPRLLKETKADLVHVQYTAPLKTPCPLITTVHDISFRLHPKWFPPKDRLLLNLTVPATMRRASAVITDSESSRRDMLRVYALPETKLSAITLGAPDGMQSRIEGVTQEIAQRFTKEKYGVTVSYFLAVGVMQPRKNLPFLVKAFAEAKARGLKSDLLLTGKMGWGSGQRDLKAILKASGVPEESLKFTGYVPDEDLPLLYRGSEAFLYPSLYEGFGLPPLEAMTCGTPVIASSAPAMPEVCGDAAHLISPLDEKGWTEALLRIEGNTALREDSIVAGHKRVAAFTWRKTAEQTLEIYRRVTL